MHGKNLRELNSLIRNGSASNNNLDLIYNIFDVDLIDIQQNK